MSVCCNYCVLSGRGFCDEPITRLEDFFRLWCVVMCDIETLWMKWAWSTGGCRAKNKTKLNRPMIIIIYYSLVLC